MAVELGNELAAAQANIDQEWAGCRDMVFDIDLGGVDALIDRLGAEDAPAWLARQPPETLRVVASLAAVAACRMSLEIIAGVLDGEDSP
jgi:hypothetical protein